MSIQSQLKEKWLLYQLVSKKDPEAFGKLYDLYTPQIYRFVYFKVSSESDAEDITAEVFLKAWEYVSEGKEIKHFAALLYRIARNRVIDLYRRRQSKVEEPIDELLLKKLSDSGRAVEKMTAANELESLIKNLQKLKDEYREVITLRYIDELTVGEIAEVLQKSQINVRVLLHRALKTIQKISEINPSAKQ